MQHLSAILALAITGVAANAGETRAWTDTTGKFSVEAELVSLSEDTVVLRRTSGKEVKVPLARLSKSDRDYAIGQSESLQTEETNPFSAIDELNQLARGITTPADNVAVKFWLAVGTDHIESEIREDYLRLLGISPASLKQKLRFETWEDYVQRKGLSVDDTKNPMKSGANEEVEKWLIRNRRSLDAVVKAVPGRSFYSPYVIYPSEVGVGHSSADYVRIVRGVARALSGRAALHLDKGDSQDAVSDLVACFQLSNHLQTGQSYHEFATGWLVEDYALRVATMALQEGVLSDQDKQRIAQALRSLPPTETAASILNGLPRIQVVEWLTRIRDGGPAELLTFLTVQVLNEPVPKRNPLPHSWNSESRDKWEKAIRDVQPSFAPYVAALSHAQFKQAKRELDQITSRRKAAMNQNSLAALVDGANHTKHLPLGAVPDEVTPSDMAEYVAYLTIPDLSKLLDAEWGLKGDLEDLLDALSE